MVITNVTTYLVRPRWGFVKIETDGGLTGWGEAVIEGKAATVLACVEEMKDYLWGPTPCGSRTFGMCCTGQASTGAAPF